MRYWFIILSTLWSVNVYSVCSFEITYNVCNLEIFCDGDLTYSFNLPTTTWKETANGVYVKDDASSLNMPLSSITNFTTVDDIFDSLTLWKSNCIDILRIDSFYISNDSLFLLTSIDDYFVILIDQDSTNEIPSSGFLLGDSVCFSYPTGDTACADIGSFQPDLTGIRDSLNALYDSISTIQLLVVDLNDSIDAHRTDINNINDQLQTHLTNDLDTVIGNEYDTLYTQTGIVLTNGDTLPDYATLDQITDSLDIFRDSLSVHRDDINSNNTLITTHIANDLDTVIGNEIDSFYLSDGTLLLNGDTLPQIDTSLWVIISDSLQPKDITRPVIAEEIYTSVIGSRSPLWVTATNKDTVMSLFRGKLIGSNESQYRFISGDQSDGLFASGMYKLYTDTLGNIGFKGIFDNPFLPDKQFGFVAFDSVNRTFYNVGTMLNGDKYEIGRFDNDDFLFNTFRMDDDGYSMGTFAPLLGNNNTLRFNNDKATFSGNGGQEFSIFSYDTVQLFSDDFIDMSADGNMFVSSGNQLSIIADSAWFGGVNAQTGIPAGTRRLDYSYQPYASTPAAVIELKKNQEYATGWAALHDEGNKLYSNIYYGTLGASNVITDIARIEAADIHSQMYYDDNTITVDTAISMSVVDDGSFVRLYDKTLTGDTARFVAYMPTSPLKILDSQRDTVLVSESQSTYLQGTNGIAIITPDHSTTEQYNILTLDTVSGFIEYQNVDQSLSKSDTIKNLRDAINGALTSTGSYYTFDYSNLYDTASIVDIDDFAFISGSTGYNFTQTTNLDITGFAAQPDNTVFLVLNTGTGDLKFKHNNTNSAVGNRIFTFEGGGDKSFKQWSSTYIIYKQSLDGGNGGWLLIEMQH